MARLSGDPIPHPKYILILENHWKPLHGVVYEYIPKTCTWSRRHIIGPNTGWLLYFPHEVLRQWLSIRRQDNTYIVTDDWKDIEAEIVFQQL